MNRQGFVKLAWLLWGLAITLVAIRLILQYLNAPESFLGNLFKVLSLVFATVGVLIAVRRPENPIGWIFEAGALLIAISDFAEQYAIFALVTRPGTIPGGLLFGWMRLWVSSIGFYLLFTFTFLLFPNGRLPSARWRFLIWLAILTAALLTIVSAFRSGPMAFIPAMENPWGISQLHEKYLWIVSITSVLTLFVVGACAVSVIVRFHRARGEEQQQLKWIAFAATLLILYSLIGIYIEIYAPQYLPLVELGEAPVFIAFPVAVGIAILKYRLFEIDLIIRRTLIYGALTSALALIYIALVTILHTIVLSITGRQQSSLVEILSTLAIAALFHPFRRWMQNAIDRRFYRSKYDAEKTMSSFSALQRDKVDLDQIEAAILGVIDEVFQPQSDSLWLRLDTIKSARKLSNKSSEKV